MEKRLEAGWGQRFAWVVLVWGCLSLLIWVPFLYVAIRRGRGSDWGAFASFVLYEAVVIAWSSLLPGDRFEALLGAVAVVAMVTATSLLLFAEFDQKTPRPTYGPGMPQPQPYAQGYQQGYPYGR